MKGKYLLKTLLCLALCFVCLMAVAACGGKEGGEKVHVGGDYLDDLPEDLDFNNEKVNIFYWGTDFLNNELTADGSTGDIVDVAIWKRNLSVEERLNVDLNPIMGDVAAEIFMPVARDEIMSGSTDYDMIIGAFYEACKVAQEGAFLDLANAKYIDYDKAYWNSDFNEALAINNKQFMVTGDISLSNIKGCACMQFDLERYEANFGDPQELYDLILSGNGQAGGWTLDLLDEYCRKSYIDLNGNGLADNGDQYGSSFDGTSSIVDLYAHSMGVQWCHRDENNIPVLDLNTEKFYDFFNDFYHALRENPGVNVYNGDYAAEAEGIQTIFDGATLNDLVERRADERDFGIIPFPKYYETDTKYHAITNPYTFSVPVTAPEDRVDMITAVMECMASEGRRLCVPAYYEYALKDKYTRDEMSTKMLDIIHEGATTNFVYVYTECIGGIGACMRQLIGYDERDFVSWYAAKESMVLTKLNALLKAFDENTSGEFVPQTEETASEEELAEEDIGDNQISTQWEVFGTKYRKSFKYVKPDMSEHFAYLYNDEDEIEVRSPTNKVAGGYYPTAIIQSRDTVPLSDLSLTFQTDEGFSYVNPEDGYAGAMSVGWTTQPITGIPEYLDGIGTNGLRACIPTGVEAYSLVVSFMGSRETPGDTIADYLYIIMFDGTDPCVEVDNRIGLRFTNRVEIDVSQPVTVEVKEDDVLGFVVSVNGVEYRTGTRGTETIDIDLNPLKDKMDAGFIIFGGESPGNKNFANFTLSEINGEPAATFFE